jgi:hypothetical protein
MEHAHIAIVVAFALIFLAIGVRGIIKRRGLMERCSAEVTGKVDSFERKESSSSDDDDDDDTRSINYTYYPVFSYQVAGKQFVKRSNVGTGHPRFDVGQSVEVSYNPDNPDEYLILDDRSSKMINYVFAGFGVLIIAIVIIVQIVEGN